MHMLHMSTQALFQEVTNYMPVSVMIELYLKTTKFEYDVDHQREHTVIVAPRKEIVFLV